MTQGKISDDGLVVAYIVRRDDIEQILNLFVTIYDTPVRIKNHGELERLVIVEVSTSKRDLARFILTQHNFIVGREK